MLLRPLGPAALAATVLLAPAAAAAGRKYTLPDLIEAARAGNPGIQAAAAATAAMEAQLAETRRSWLPQGEILSLFAPAPELRCVPSMPNPGPGDDRGWREAHCDATDVGEPGLTRNNLDPARWGVFTRTELKLTQPVFTFGKITAGVRAAEAGLALARERAAGARADLEANVRKAYWGLKLSREVVATIDEGLGYVDEAQKKIDKDLGAGTGTATVTDRLRVRTIRAEAEARLLEAKRLGELARAGLRTLLGAETAADLDIDDDPLEPLAAAPKPLAYWEEQALAGRPEARLLAHAVHAKQALADLERNRLYPDLVIVGTATYAYASKIDNPKNAFANDPFNTLGAGVAAAFRMPLDLGSRASRADRAAAEAHEIELRRREALGGIALDVEKAYGEFGEASERVRTVHKGEKAGKAWITAVAQNFEVGLAETRDFADGLSAFFQMRIRYLQAVYDQRVAAAALGRATGTEVTP